MQCPSCKEGELEFINNETFDDHADVFYACAECDKEYWGRIEVWDLHEHK